MLKSKLYSKYYPVTGKWTQFEEDEKKRLCHWAEIFPYEVLYREGAKEKQGFQYYSSYNLEGYDVHTMVEMIKKNCFDELYLLFINCILYRHKYNSFFSIFLFPMLSDEKFEKDMKSK